MGLLPVLLLLVVPKKKNIRRRRRRKGKDIGRMVVWWRLPCVWAWWRRTRMVSSLLPPHHHQSKQHMRTYFVRLLRRSVHFFFRMMPCCFKILCCPPMPVVALTKTKIRITLQVTLFAAVTALTKSFWANQNIVTYVCQEVAEQLDLTFHIQDLKHLENLYWIWILRHNPTPKKVIKTHMISMTLTKLGKGVPNSVIGTKRAIHIP